MKIIEINNQILQKFRDHHIAMRWYLDAEQYKSSSLSDGWMKNGMILSVNNNIEIEPFCAFYAGVYRSVGIHEMSGLCNMGSFSYSFSALPDGFKVGRYCSIAEGLRFLDGYHPIDRITTSVVSHKNHFISGMYYAHNDINFNIKDAMYSDPSGYPEIGNDVWIGRDVTMKMGVKIGDGAILAAQSVVTKNVEPFTVVAGNPAKPIKKRFDDATIESLINSNIFGYNLVDLAAHNIIDYKLPKDAAEKITELSGLGKISLYTPKKLKLLAI